MPGEGVTLDGTSPRMRGKPARETGIRPLGGNIPAYAGKTAVWILGLGLL